MVKHFLCPLILFSQPFSFKSNRSHVDVLQPARSHDWISLLRNYGAPAASSNLAKLLESSTAGEEQAAIRGVNMANIRFCMSDEQALQVIRRAKVPASIEDVRLIAIKNLNFLLVQAMTFMEHDHVCVLTEEHVLRALPLFLR